MSFAIYQFISRIVNIIAFSVSIVVILNFKEIQHLTKIRIESAEKFAKVKIGVKVARWEREFTRRPRISVDKKLIEQNTLPTISPLRRCRRARQALISSRAVIFLADSAEHNLFPMPDETHCRRDGVLGGEGGRKRVGSRRGEAAHGNEGLKWSSPRF